MNLKNHYNVDGTVDGNADDNDEFVSIHNAAGNVQVSVDGDAHDSEICIVPGDVFYIGVGIPNGYYTLHDNEHNHCDDVARHQSLVHLAVL